LLKMTLADECGIDLSAMLPAQREVIAQLAASIGGTDAPDDVVALWRVEASAAALRFIDRVIARG
jgi:hypothetical protein